MDLFTKMFIIIHAIFGGIALISGLIAMIVKKGNNIHKKSGSTFFYSMVLCGISAMVIALLPGHESLFFFAIGIFSLYFVLTGNRSLKFKEKAPNLKIDKVISVTMIITGVLMIILPVLLTNSIHIILSVFGTAGIILSIRDLILFKNLEKLKKQWLQQHLSKMIGGYISASTAFVVVNQLLPGLWAWFTPSIIGGMVITYWIIKVSKVPVNKA